MAEDDRSRSEAARQKRQEQLKRWLGSETERSGPGQRDRGGAGGRRPRVRFAQGAVFMACCSAGDRDEVAALLKQGAEINHANVDGLTALHQACIDENIEMVRYLLENGADINQPDNEGWTALHAAASCGFLDITQYLLQRGAWVGSVNSEGELPLDVSQDEAMTQLLQAELRRQGVDVDSARRQEESLMLQDALALLSHSGVSGLTAVPGVSVLTPHPKTGATALHVAAAKGYVEVLKVLLQCGVDVDVRDNDGWTPLHAAAHWGQREACRLLAESLCDMGAQNNVAQSPFDVADEDLEDLLEELQKKQSALRSERQKAPLSPLIETSTPFQSAPARTRRSSISRMSSKEKISLHERERHAPPTWQPPPPEDEEEEGGPAGASSSSSSEQESESESDADSEKAKTREIINNLNNKLHSPALPGVSTATSSPGRKVPSAPKVTDPPGKPPIASRAAEGDRQDHTVPPGGWRTLHKTGSSGALGVAGLAGGNRELSTTLDSSHRVTRSASSPRLSSTDSDSREPRLARVPPTPARRLFSVSDSSQDASSSGSLARSSSYTRRLLSQSGSDSSPAVPRSSSFGRRPDVSTATSVTTATPSSALNRPNSLLAQRLVPEQADRKDPVSMITTSTTSTTTAGQGEAKERRRSYLTPVRDEEAEAQRRAKSRDARRTRRSTQGVTLTDLQEAEKTAKTEQKEREKKKEDEEEKEREGRQRRGEEEVSWRSRIATLQKSDLLGLTSPSGAGRPTRAPASLVSEGRDGQQGGASESEERMGVAERRRARARRRVALGLHIGESDLCDNEPGGEEEVGGSVQDPEILADRFNRRLGSSANDCCSRGPALCADPASDTKDYRKLFEKLSQENSQLQAQLQDTQRLISQTRLDLDKATQRQERFADCTALLELERKERRMLEKRISELEEELKVLGDLKSDNLRLKDENGALIRVISKLSK